MNRVILMGRPTADPEINYANTQSGQIAVARYTLAVDRAGKDKGADFIRCVAFGKAAEFAEKYVFKGQRVLVSGRIQTGSYTDKDGKKVYTIDVIVDSQEFADAKRTNADPEQNGTPVGDGFMSIPDGIDDESLPFN